MPASMNPFSPRAASTSSSLKAFSSSDRCGMPSARRCACRNSSEMIPGCRFEVFPEGGHFPHRDEPRRFVKTLTDFIETTEPADVDDADFRDLLRGDA